MVKKGPSKTSNIWDYFNEAVIGDAVYSKCNVENCNYHNKGKNTTTLKRHLKNEHTDLYTVFLQTEEKKPKNQSITIFTKCLLQKSFAEKFSDHLVQFFACGTVPISLIENPDFRSLLEVLNADVYEFLPSRITLSNRIDKFYYDSNTIIRIFFENCCKVSFCCDVWSQKNFLYSYLGIVAQFYSTEMKKVINIAIEIVPLKHPHTAATIQKAIKKSLNFWSILAKKIDFFITDQGANMISAFNINISDTVLVNDAERGDNRINESEVSKESDVTDESEVSNESDVSDESNVSDEPDVTYESDKIAFCNLNSEELEIDVIENSSYVLNFDDINRLDCLAHILNVCCAYIFKDKQSYSSVFKQNINSFISEITSS